MRYYNRKLDPITRERYLELDRDPAYRFVAVDREGPIRVSTLWLGVNHDHYGHAGTPIVFETMVLDDGDAEAGRPRGIVDGAFRWTSEEEAIEGHARLCREHLGRDPRPDTEGQVPA